MCVSLDVYTHTNLRGICTLTLRVSLNKLLNFLNWFIAERCRISCLVSVYAKQQLSLLCHVSTIKQQNSQWCF